MTGDPMVSFRCATAFSWARGLLNPDISSNSSSMSCELINAATALLQERDESAPAVLRHHVGNEFEIDQNGSSIQRLLSDNLLKIDAVETGSNG